jgi:hypothetical protein
LCGPQNVSPCRRRPRRASLSTTVTPSVTRSRRQQRPKAGAVLPASSCRRVRGGVDGSPAYAATMDDERAGQFAISLTNGARLVRLPPGLAAGWWHLMFVLSGPSPVVDGLRKHDGLWGGIPSCLEFESPHGVFSPAPSAGGSGAGQGDNIQYRF